MIITIISPTRIEIDGQDAGMPLDLFLSREDLRPLIREEFVAWHARHVVEDQKREKDFADKESAIRKECDDKVAAIEADMAVLGTKQEVIALRNKQRRDALLKELSTLDGNVI